VTVRLVGPPREEAQRLAREILADAERAPAFVRPQLMRVAALLLILVDDMEE